MSIRSKSASIAYQEVEHQLYVNKEVSWNMMEVNHKAWHVSFILGHGKSDFESLSFASVSCNQFYLAYVICFAHHSGCLKQNVGLW